MHEHELGVKATWKLRDPLNCKSIDSLVTENRLQIQ